MLREFLSKGRVLISPVHENVLRRENVFGV